MSDEPRQPRTRGIGSLVASADAPQKATPRKIALRPSAATIHFHPKGETKAMRDAARAAKRAAAEVK